MNVKKTKTMVVSRRVEDEVIRIKVDNTILEQVKKFTYLGQIITDDGNCDREIRKRIEMARKSFINMKDVLCSRRLNLNTRKRLVKCYILSTFLYACETWTFNAEAWRRIEAFEMWLYRRMLKISYVEHKTNDEVLNLMKTKRELVKNIKIRKTRYFGHIIRGERLQKDLMEGVVEGIRKRGRPRRMWTTDIKDWTGRSYGGEARTAQDRWGWHVMTANLR